MITAAVFMIGFTFLFLGGASVSWFEGRAEIRRQEAGRR